MLLKNAGLMGEFDLENIPRIMMRKSYSFVLQFHKQGYNMMLLKQNINSVYPLVVYNVQISYCFKIMGSVRLILVHSKWTKSTALLYENNCGE